MRLSRKKVEFVQKAKLHNEFRIILTDSRTGKVKQEARAYNIILDEGLRRWVTHLGSEGLGVKNTMMIPHSGRSDRCFGGRIFLGTGLSESSVDPSATSLITPLGQLDAEFFDDRFVDNENGTAKFTQVATTIVGQFQGSIITEIGLGNPSSAIPSTHAFIEDAAGKPIGIEIGEFDKLTIYAVVYIKLEHSYGNNIKFVGGDSGNVLLRMVGDNASCNDEESGIARSPIARIDLGHNRKELHSSDDSVVSYIDGKTIEYGTPDLQNFKVMYTIPRFEPENGNHMLGVKEIGASIRVYRASFGPASFSTYSPLFRSVMPVLGVFDKYEVEGEELGDGDNERTIFELKWFDIIEDSEKIYVEGRDPELQVRDADYVFNNILFPYGSNFGAFCDLIVLEGATINSGALVNVVTDGNLNVTVDSRSGAVYVSNPGILLVSVKESGTGRYGLDQRIILLPMQNFRGLNCLAEG